MGMVYDPSSEQWVDDGSDGGSSAPAPVPADGTGGLTPPAAPGSGGYRQPSGIAGITVDLNGNYYQAGSNTPLTPQGVQKAIADDAVSKRAGAQVNLSLGQQGLQANPLVPLTASPGYAQNRGLAPVTRPDGTVIQQGDIIGPDGQVVRDPATIAQITANEAAFARHPSELAQAQVDQIKALITQKNKELAQTQQLNDFTISKGKFEESIGANTDARATQQQAFSQQQQIASIGLQIAQLTQTHNQAQAQLAFQVQQANVQANYQKQQQLQGLATNIATTAANPGDRAKEASLLLANSGWGQQDQALASTDLRTPQSVAPLQALLDQRQSVMAQPDNPISAPNIGPLDLSGIQMPQATTGAGTQPAPVQAGIPQALPGSTTPLNLNVATPYQATATPGGGAQQANLGGGMNQSAAPIGGATFNGAPIAGAWGGAGPSGVTAAAKGGVVKGAYLGDEKGAEIHIPLGAGLSFVVPHDKIKPSDLKNITKMAAGGVFSSGSLYGGTGIDPNSQNTAGAFDFLNQSVQNATAGTPWAGGIPTPVYASSPGFAPENTQMLAGLSAQATGIDPATYQRIAAMLTPAGANEAPTRRTG